MEMTDMMKIIHIVMLTSPISLRRSGLRSTEATSQMR